MGDKNKILSRLLLPPKGSFFLFGPRGTGKSTWISHDFQPNTPVALTINLLSEAEYHEHLRHPGLLAQQLETLPQNTWVVIDEIQRVPSLLNEVHRFIETKRLKFVLCGSSARKLKHAGTNLLAGRAIECRLHPFVPEELGSTFDLQTALTYGTLPVVWMSPTPSKTLFSYVNTYLKQEIQAEALVRALSGFLRFLPVATLFHGQKLNISGVARDTGTARSTVMGYLQILEDTLLTFLLPALETKIRVRERKHPKLYFVDPGIVRAIKKHAKTITPEEKGALLEGWFASLLRAYKDYRDIYEEMGYWSPTDAHHLEVDFLLRQGNDYIAIEVKSGNTPPSSDTLKGLKAIQDLPNLKRRLIVSLYPKKLKNPDGIEALSIEHFLEELSENRVWR